MTGVEILNEYAVASSGSFNYWVALGIFIFILIVGVVVCIRQKEVPLIIIFVVLGVMMGGVAGGVFGALAPLEQHQITRYEVVIDDSVSMNDFSEKYEVIEQKGKIFIVEEKE